MGDERESSGLTRRGMLGATAAAATAATAGGLLLGASPAAADGFDAPSATDYGIPLRRLAGGTWTPSIATGSKYILNAATTDPPVAARESVTPGCAVNVSKWGSIGVMHLRMLLGRASESSEHWRGPSLDGGAFKARSTPATDLVSTVEVEGAVAFWGGDFPAGFRPRMPNHDVDQDGQSGWTGTGYIGVQKAAAGKWPYPEDHLFVEAGWTYTTAAAPSSGWRPGATSGLFPALMMSTGRGSHFTPENWIVGWRKGTAHSTDDSGDVLGARHPFTKWRFTDSGAAPETTGATPGPAEGDGEWPAGTKLLITMVYEIGPDTGYAA